MNRERAGFRSKNVFENGQLVIKGQRFPCTLDNISFSGAMVSYVFSNLGILTGESCGLKLSKDPNKCVDYLCKIVRIAPNEIGLRFINWRIQV